MKKQLTIIATAILLVLSGFAVETNAAELSQPELTRLQREVRHELVTLPYYSVFDYFTFSTKDGEVTLMGYANRPTLKKSAERVVKSIEGVTLVNNEIKVLPVSPNDDRIRRSVYRAIYYHPALTRYAIQAIPPVHIIVENGDVTLMGVVGSEQDKTIANIRANGVSGVFSVTNELEVVRD